MCRVCSSFSRRDGVFLRERASDDGDTHPRHPGKKDPYLRLLRHYTHTHQIFSLTPSITYYWCMTAVCTNNILLVHHPKWLLYCIVWFEVLSKMVTFLPPLASRPLFEKLSTFVPVSSIIRLCKMSWWCQHTIFTNINESSHLFMCKMCEWNIDEHML